MNVKPVKSYKAAKYPDKEIIYIKPELLYRVPERWKTNVIVGAALSSILLITFSGCKQKLNDADVNRPTDSINLTEDDLVAPIFNHGNGRGGFGCVAVAPPNFLSEDEALQVVQEESAKYNIDFSRRQIVFKNVNLPVTNLGRLSDEEMPTKQGELLADGYDDEKKISFEYVSSSDVYEWRNGDGFSSYTVYDTWGAAKALRDGLVNKTEGVVTGILYDPMKNPLDITKKYDKKFEELRNRTDMTSEEKLEEYHKIDEEYRAELKEATVSELREQVRDFLNWLKGQGII